MCPALASPSLARQGVAAAAAEDAVVEGLGGVQALRGAQALLVEGELEAGVGLALERLAREDALDVGDHEVDRLAVAHDVVRVEEEVLAVGRVEERDAEEPLAALEVERADELVLARAALAGPTLTSNGGGRRAHGMQRPRRPCAPS